MQEIKSYRCHVSTSEVTSEKMGDDAEPSQLYEAVVWVSAWFFLQEKLEWQVTGDSQVSWKNQLVRLAQNWKIWRKRRDVKKHVSEQINLGFQLTISMCPLWDYSQGVGVQVWWDWAWGWRTPMRRPQSSDLVQRWMSAISIKNCKKLKSWYKAR